MLRPASYILCFILVLIAAGIAPDAKAQIHQEEQRARTALSEGRIGEALTLLDRILTQDAGNVNALLLRARAHESRNEFSRAIADYNQVLQRTPDNVLAREGVQRARAQNSSAQQRELEGLHAQVTANPNDLGLLLRYANLLYDAKAFKQAAGRYRQYLQRGQPVPDIVERYLIAIASYEGDNDLGEAEAARFLRIYPTDSNLHMRLGYFRLWQGKHREAQEAFTEALRHDASNRDAQTGLQQAQSRPQVQVSAAPREFIIDRLLRELRQTPDDTAKRFELVEAFIRYERFFEAYDQLVLLADQHQSTDRWRTLLVTVDEALTRTSGPSPDRLLLRLRQTPDALELRYSLVEELLQRGRLFEAFQTLTEPEYANPVDPRYQALLQRLIEQGDLQTAQRVADLERAVESNPGDVEATRALIDNYLVAQRVNDALALYEALMARLPDDVDLRLAYIRTLREHGRTDLALSEAQHLLATNPLSTDYRRAFVLASIAAGEDDLLVGPYINEITSRNPADKAFLLDLVTAYLAADVPAQAAYYLQRAQAIGDDLLSARTEHAQVLVERATLHAAERARFDLLEEARRLTRGRAFAEALMRYDAFFAAQGRHSREEMKGVAQLHEAAGESDQAYQVLAALYVQYPEYDLAKQIAKHHLYTGNFELARRDLEALIPRNPGDYEVRLLLGDTFRELGRYDRARDLYREMLEIAPTSRVAHTRLALLEDRVRVAGSLGGFSYGLQITPVSQFVRGSGSGTSYERWGRGARAQIYVPLPVVLEAGYVSHVVEGTRRLVPDAEHVTTEINQFHAGGYLDLTRPIAAPVSYTNRLGFEAGIYVYPDGRQRPFGAFHYWRQQPGWYTASIGVQNTEGTIGLWSPAGAEFDLRLTQIDARLGLARLLPDSLLRVDATVLVNVVTDKYGTLGSEAGSNTGVQVLLDAGYRVLRDTYFGLRYDRLDYQSTVDIYYSPNQFQSYYVWLEYMQPRAQKVSLRLRGSLGVSARTSGFVSRQFESTVTYRLTRKLSLNTALSIGQSSRPFVSTPTRALDSYSTFIVSGFLSWSL